MRQIKSSEWRNPFAKSHSHITFMPVFMCSMSPLRATIHIRNLLRMWCGCMQYACLNVKQNSNLNCSAFCLNIRKKHTQLLLHNCFVDCTISHSIHRSERLNYDFWRLLRSDYQKSAAVERKRRVFARWRSVYIFSFSELSHLKSFPFSELATRRYGKTPTSEAVLCWNI